MQDFANNFKERSRYFVAEKVGYAPVQQLTSRPNQERFIPCPNILVGAIQVKLEHNLIYRMDQGLHARLALLGFSQRFGAFSNQAAETQAREGDDQQDELEHDETMQVFRE